MIMTSPAVDRDKRREESLCKFIREYMLKVAQIVVAARSASPSSARRHSHAHHQHDNEHDRGHVDVRGADDSLSSSWNNLEAPCSQWFRLEMTDSVRIQKYVEEQCIGHWDARHSDFTLTVDISLSAEPLQEHVLLERWKVKLKRDRDRRGSGGGNALNGNVNALQSECNDPSLIYKRMTMQIRSILSYLRLLDTQSIVQCQEQSMAQQSMLMHLNTANMNGDDHIDGGVNANASTVAAVSETVPFALYHLIYARHNRPNDRISNFVGDSKSFCFEPLRTSMGTIRTAVFYGADIRRDFEWLIRSVPGKNPPIDDNLSQHIDARSRYWDKRRRSESDHDSDDKQQTVTSTQSAAATTTHCDPDPDPTSLEMEMVDRHSPPIKSLNAVHFHESPVLHTNSPAVDPRREMERIRLSGSTVFGAAPPVISLADVSAHRESIQSSSCWGSGSQLMQSIIHKKRGQIMASKKATICCIEDKGDVDKEDEGNLNLQSHSNQPSMEMVDGDSVHSVISDMSVEASDHGDIQEEVFEGYDDEDGHRIAIAKMSGFITMCIAADKLKLKSFERRDWLLSGKEMEIEEERRDSNCNGKGIGKGQSAENEKCLKMLSRHFEVRQQRMIEMKRTSSNVLSSSVMLQH